MTDVRFTVLGRVAVEVDGVDVRIPGRRERSVLALLVAGRGQVVSVDRMIADIWGEAPARSAQSSLQVAVSRLRALVEPDRAPRAAPALLVSSGSGYALRAAPHAIDAEAFVVLVDEAHRALADGRPAEALEQCDAAATTWTGDPFADVVAGELVESERRRLEELRVCLHELRAEALLGLGRHALVTGELEALVTAYPFRERLWSLHALALYRSSRQADALGALSRARTLLREELGVDPSPELQRLEADLLAQDPGLGVVPRIAPVVVAPPSPSPSTPPSTLPSPSHPPGRGMVGRDDALDRLCEALDRIVDGGAGRTVVVSGEAGIGKTLLVTELADRAAGRGARVLWGRCHEADVSPAYWPWVPVVRELAGAHPSAEVVALLDASGDTSSGDAGAAALRTYDAVTRLLAASAGEGPVVVLLEDLHWADTASLQLLAYAAEAVRGVPVLLVATTRDVGVAGDPLQSCLAALGRVSADRVDLHGLPSGQVHRLVSRLTGGEIDEELAGVVAERTDGNPFFVIELVRLLAARDRLDVAGARDVAVPHGVQDVLRLRLARLPEAVRVLLGVAAVAGREFALDPVAGVSGRSAEETIDLLEVAVNEHAVEEADAPGRYRFAHALVRETLYHSLSLARRGLLHAAVARALEPRLADDPDLVPEVAHHFVLGAAMLPELAESAVRHSMTAARMAEGRGALDQALVHWEDALTADTAAARRDERRRYGVLLGLGQARHRRADVEGSREALGEAMRLARGLGDLGLLAGAAASFRGAGVWHWREFGTSDPAMVAVLRECVDHCETGPLQIRVMVSLSMELTYEWRSREAEEVGRRAVAAARALGDDAVFADVVAVHALAQWGKPGGAAWRLQIAEEALALGPSKEQELYLRFGAAAAHLQQGDTVEAERQMTRCRELARRLRHRGADVPIAWWGFYRAIDAADRDTAERLLGQALDLHRQSSVVGMGDMSPLARLRLGGPGTAPPADVVETLRTHANPAFRAMVAHALVESGGRPEKAVDFLGPPVPDGAWDYASVYGDCLRVDVLASAGCVDRLPEALERIRPWGHELAVYGSTDCIGSVDYFVARGLEGLGDLDGARRGYARAAEANRAAGILPWLSRAEQRLGSLAG